MIITCKLLCVKRYEITKKYSSAVASKNVVDSGNSICSGCGKSVAGAVKADIEDFVVVSLECVDAFAWWYVP